MVRDHAGMAEGLAELVDRRAAADHVDVRPSAEGWPDLAQALDLRAGLLVAEATLRGAPRVRRSTSRSEL